MSRPITDYNSVLPETLNPELVRLYSTKDGYISLDGVVNRVLRPLIVDRLAGAGVSVNRELNAAGSTLPIDVSRDFFKVEIGRRWVSPGGTPIPQNFDPKDFAKALGLKYEDVRSHLLPNPYPNNIVPPSFDDRAAVKGSAYFDGERMIVRRETMLGALGLTDHELRQAVENGMIADLTAKAPQAGKTASKGNSNLNAAYTGATIQHTDGKNYAVLDTTKLNFDSPDAAYGKKTKPTEVRIAKPGELVVTIINGVEESRVTAKDGEPIFINTLPDGKKDTFIPPDGKKVLAEKYELVSGDPAREATYRPKSAPSKILLEAVQKPTVIKDAWGPGQHQFLDAGATLKQDGAKATGIAKAAFNETWSVTNEHGKPFISREYARDRIEERSALRAVEEQRAIAAKAKIPSAAATHLKGGALGVVGAGSAAAMEAHNGVGAAVRAAQEAILPGSTTAGGDACKIIGTVAGGVAGTVVAGAAGAAAFTGGTATAVPILGPAAPVAGGAAALAAGGATFSITQPVVKQGAELACNKVADAIKSVASSVSFGGSDRVAQNSHTDAAKSKDRPRQ